MLLTLTISLVREHSFLLNSCDFGVYPCGIWYNCFPPKCALITVNVGNSEIIKAECYLYSNMAGYGKMPEYEHIFTDFLLSLAESNYKRRSGSNS